MSVASASIDFETGSECDLTKVGASRYSHDPSTHPVCMGWAIGTDEPDLWLPGDPCPAGLVAHIQAGGTLCAWNAQFERLIWENVMVPRFGWPAVRPEQWSCTMARAMYYGLPASLEMAAPALEIAEEKDAAGKMLMRLFMQPTGYTACGAPLWAIDDPAQQDRLTQYHAYCLQDVATEQAIALKVPPLPPREQKIWLADQRMNMCGMVIDTELVQTMRGLAEQARHKLDAEMRTLTAGAVANTRARAAFLNYIQQHIDPLDLMDRPQLLDPDRNRWQTGSAKRDVLLDLRKVVDPDGLAVIDCWLDAARAAPKKLDALAQATDPDGRLRCNVRYYGAGRTGRWSGAGGTRVQFQNIARPLIKQIDPAIDLMLSGASVDELDDAGLGEPTLGIITSCLRGCFVAPPGEQLLVSDLAQIEARVLPWLAGQEDVLDVFRRKEDIYTYTAASIGSTNRQLGKVVRLALGFGMGAEKFIKTAAQYGIELALADAMALVRTYRETNAFIMQLWWDLERAMVRTIKRDPWDPDNLTQLETVGVVRFQRLPNGVAMELPVGRYLFYRNARLEARSIYDEQGNVVDIDPTRDEIVYDGVHQRTRKWGRLKAYGGKLAEHATQATARDVIADDWLELDARGHELVGVNHDELIGTAPVAKAQARYAEMLDVMSTEKWWAPGLPVAAEGFIADRYRK